MEGDTTNHGLRKRLHIPYLLAAIILLAAFSVGMYVGKSNSSINGLSVFNGASAEQPGDLDLAPLWKAWNIIGEKYVPASDADAVSEEDLVYGAIKGLTAALGDPYTVFLPPEQAEIFNEDIRGNFEGVGMEIGMRGGSLVVIAPLRGTPAERAGVKSGDRILQIDEEATDGITVDQAVQRIRGERGTVVTLTVQREGESELLTIPITRDVIEIPTIETTTSNNSGLREDGVFVIRLFNFSAISPGLFRGALREFVESGSNKLILDLRGNPGGFLEASVDIASWFLPTGKVVVSEDFGGDSEARVHRSKGYNVFNDSLEMVILIDQGSASASEIVAGALREHDKAILVGENTFGKGSVQELVDVTGNTSIKVTIARWLTPNGNSISDGGLTPDIEVEITEEDIKANRDTQLDRAVEYLRNK